MRYSEQTGDLFAALAEFQSELTPPPKNRTVVVQHKSGGQHSFAYAELGTIWAHIAPLWKKAGLIWIGDVQRDERGQPRLVTRIGHKSGQWMESEFPLPNIQDTKAFAGEITYARRYVFSMMLGISSQEDADDMPDRQPRQRQEQRQPQQRAPQPAKETGAGTAPQGGARIKPATPPGSGGSQAPAPASAPQRPGQKEREECVDLATANNWPVERIPEFLKLKFHVGRLDALTMDQYGELKKIITGDQLFEEVMEAARPKPGEFGYVGPAPEAKKEPGSDG